MLLGHDNRMRQAVPAAEISRAEQHAGSEWDEARKTDSEAHRWQSRAGRAELRTMELSLQLAHVFHLAYLGTALERALALRRPRSKRSAEHHFTSPRPLRLANHLRCGVV
jgi:hypothetical protein